MVELSYAKARLDAQSYIWAILLGTERVTVKNDVSISAKIHTDHSKFIASWQETSRIKDRGWK